MKMASDFNISTNSQKKFRASVCHKSSKSKLLTNGSRKRLQKDGLSKDYSQFNKEVSLDESDSCTFKGHKSSMRKSKLMKSNFNSGMYSFKG